MKTLNISKNLSLPAEDALESVIGIIGKRGKGKSGAVKVLMEELVRKGLPFVAFDPNGIMYGIRSSFDGSQPSGMKVLVIGGPHGDLPLDRRAGAQVAKEIIASNISCIIDFKGQPKAAYREFVTDFSAELIASNTVPRVVIIDEAHKLVPQLIRPDMTKTFDAVEDLVGTGRNQGIGVVFLVTRPAKINKDILSEVDALIVFGLIGEQDLKAIKAWVGAQADPKLLKEFMAGIAGLQAREFWFWAPAAFGVHFEKHRVKDFTTFHPDKTHLRKLGLLKVKPVTTDITEVVGKLGPVMEKLAKEKATASTLPQLQARIRALEGELSKAKARPPPAPTKPVIMRVEVAAVKPADIKRLEHLVAKAHATADTLKSLAVSIGVEGGRLSAALTSVGHPRTTHVGGRPLDDIAKSVTKKLLRNESPVVRFTRPAPTIAGEMRSLDEPSLRSGERRMLQTLVQRHPIKLTRAQLATLSGFTASGGTFGTYFGVLKRHGLLHENGDDSVVATEAGITYLGGDVPPAPSTTQEILDMWRRNLSSGEWRMLDCLVQTYPNALSREQLGIATEFEHSGGTFGTYLGVLRRNGLVEVDGDQVKASATLFIDGE